MPTHSVRARARAHTHTQIPSTNAAMVCAGRLCGVALFAQPLCRCLPAVGARARAGLLQVGSGVSSHEAGREAERH